MRNNRFYGNSRKGLKMKYIDNFKYIKIIKATYVALPVHCTLYSVHTQTWDTLQRHNTVKFETNIPRKGIAPASVPISTFTCL
jgi:hypothetical protein